MKLEKLTYAKNIKVGEITISEGIVNTKTLQLYCVCDKETADEILAQSKQIESLQKDNEELKENHDKLLKDYITDTNKLKERVKDAFSRGREVWGNGDYKWESYADYLEEKKLS